MILCSTGWGHSRPFEAKNDSTGLLHGDVVYRLLVSYSSKWTERQISCGHIKQRDPDGPEIHGGSEGFSNRLSQHGPLTHVRVEEVLHTI